MTTTPKHRFQHHIEDFNKAAAFIEKKNLESLFDGPKKLDDILADYITSIEREKAYQQGLKDGAAKAHKEMAEQIRTHVEKYIGKVVKVANYVAQVAGENLAKTVKFVITDARAKFSLDKDRIQLLFLIDTSFEKEIEFIKLCGHLEKLLRELEQDYLCSISCVNVGISPDEVDYSLIKSDYPFVIKVINQ